MGVWHAKRPYDILRNEVLPTILLARYELGRLRNWHQKLELSFNLKDDLNVDCLQYDAKYRWIDRQPDLYGAEPRTGYIEVTRSQLDPLSDKRADQDHLDGKFEPQLRHNNANLTEMREKAIERIREKICKNYSENTTLIVWIFQEENLAWSNSVFSEESLAKKVQEMNNSEFSGIFVVGLNTTGRWLAGSGL